MTYEQLFSAELAIAGAARYLRHLYRITRERNYSDALDIVMKKYGEIAKERLRKLSRRAAA